MRFGAHRWYKRNTTLDQLDKYTLLSQSGSYHEYAFFWVWFDQTFTHLGFDSDFAQISEQKIGCFIHFHTLSSIFIHFHPFSSTSTHFHPLSSTPIHSHPLPSTFIHFHSYHHDITQFLLIGGKVSL